MIVHTVKSSDLQPKLEYQTLKRSSLELEIENWPEVEEHGRFYKKTKQWKVESNVNDVHSYNYNLLDEPSPLGLKLRKSPSLLELIQITLSRGNSSVEDKKCGEEKLGQKKDFKGKSNVAPQDKLKASNFPVSLLRIGTWERISRYDGDLVAKFYFAKHRCVWEVLDGGLKSKVEIQWSDITDLKASCPENGPGTLEIVLGRPPLFFKETNPQPRKHTLWQATSDFTDGEASIVRRHYLQCSQGLLNKHFEKLLQCNPRLNLLSQQPSIPLDSPYFEQKAHDAEIEDESKFQSSDNLKIITKDDAESTSTISTTRNSPSPYAPQSSASASTSELHDDVGRTLNLTSSPSSVMDSWAIEENVAAEISEKNPLEDDEPKGSTLHVSVSMTDLMNQIEQCISDQFASGGNTSEETQINKNTYEELTQYLFSDSNVSLAPDEKKLMSKVNSLCCLLQLDPSTIILKDSHEPPNNGRDTHQTVTDPESKNPNAECNDLGDLLINLPRIPSFPRFLLDSMED